MQVRYAISTSVVGIMVLWGAGILASVGTIPAARAADANTCKGYAQHAVDIAKQAPGVKCPIGASTGRWSVVFNDHFNWCLTVRNSTLDSENVERDKLIGACTRDNATCNDYANHAVQANSRIQGLQCAEKNAPAGRWSADFQGHYHWCRTAITKSSRLKDETDARDKVITRCARCEIYADGAVASAHQLFARGCGGQAFGGRWSTNREDHRLWCLGARESTQNGEDNARKTTLANCKATARPNNPGKVIAVPQVKFCSDGCEACQRDKLRCDVNGDCGFKNVRAPYACY
jgi:hypothetical protein